MEENRRLYPLELEGSRTLGPLDTRSLQSSEPRPSPLGGRASSPGQSHCVPCNTFGEQREIYEWIRLFFKPPWKQKSKICLLHSKTERRIHSKTAIFNRPIQGGLAHQKCYARVQPGHSVKCYALEVTSNSTTTLWTASYIGQIIHQRKSIPNLFWLVNRFSSFVPSVVAIWYILVPPGTTCSINGTSGGGNATC